nr:relaxase/mobilization nuclease domain-containing protein [Okeania sp. SIO2F4]
MRTKCSCSGSFRATLSYVMGKQRARLITTNIPVTSVEMKDKTKEIIQTMILRSKGHKTSKNCYHISISPTDRDLELGISDRQWIDISESFTQKIGLEKNPRVCVVHEDTGRPHLHLVFSLIDRNSRRTHLHHNYYKNQAALKEVEQEFGLEHTWENNYWLHTSSPEKEYNDRFNKYRSLLQNLGVNDFLVGKYRLQLNNNSNIDIYDTSSAMPLISASFAEDRWLIEHNNSRQKELLIFQQLDLEIQGYFQKCQSNKNRLNTKEMEL